MFNFLKKKSISDKKSRVHVLVEGRVQGVFYRETCRKKAQRLGVTGWVMNLKDGKVEAVFEGEEVLVNKMVDWAKRGSIFASVDSFNVLEEDYKEEFKTFGIRYDL